MPVSPSNKYLLEDCTAPSYSQLGLLFQNLACFLLSSKTLSNYLDWKLVGHLSRQIMWKLLLHWLLCLPYFNSVHYNSKCCWPSANVVIFDTLVQTAWHWCSPRNAVPGELWGHVRQKVWNFFLEKDVLINLKVALSSVCDHGQTTEA